MYLFPNSADSFASNHTIACSSPSHTTIQDILYWIYLQSIGSGMIFGWIAAVRSPTVPRSFGSSPHVGSVMVSWPRQEYRSLGELTEGVCCELPLNHRDINPDSYGNIARLQLYVTFFVRSSLAIFYARVCAVEYAGLGWDCDQEKCHDSNP